MSPKRYASFPYRSSSRREGAHYTLLSEGIRSPRTTVLPDVALHGVPGILGGLSESVLSWVLLRDFQRIHGRANHSPAHGWNSGSVHNHKREKKRAVITPSLSALLWN